MIRRLSEVQTRYGYDTTLFKNSLNIIKAQQRCSSLSRYNFSKSADPAELAEILHIPAVDITEAFSYIGPHVLLL